MMTQLKKYLGDRYAGQQIFLTEHAIAIDFSDVVPTMGRVARQVGAQPIEFYVESFAIACRDCDRWLVCSESADCLTEYGCTDVWHKVSDTARQTQMVTPIMLKRGENLTITLESRLPSVRSAVLQLIGTRVSPRRSVGPRNCGIPYCRCTCEMECIGNRR